MILKKLSSKDFHELKSGHTKKIRTHNFVFFYQNVQLGYESLFLAYGITVTKKRIKSAVMRNRIKRLLREALRNIDLSNKLNIPVMVNIVYAPKSKNNSSLYYNDVYKEIEVFISKLYK